MEEELKIGEQEREGLRIETQRLRDELSDLRVEAEIVQEKLRIAEATIERHHQRKVSNHLASDSLRPRSPASEASTSATTLSSPTTASTPPRTKTGALRPDNTPPSPPLSDAPPTSRPIPSTPMPKRKMSIALDPAATPRAGLQSRPARHSRNPSIPAAARQSIGAAGRATPSIRTTAPAPRAARPSLGSNAPAGGLPRSGSLYQIRGLIGKMQKLEERVYSARSKLPAPTNTPPRASPRNGSALGHYIPNNVTMRSSRKRTSQASAASSINNAALEAGVSRLSFGVPSSREPTNSRPSSRASMSSASGRPESRGALQRPESRSGIQRPESRSGLTQRPESRGSTRTPLGHYSSASMSGRIQRPRSSLSGISGGHGHSQSLSMSLREADTGSNSDGSNVATPVARRLTLEKSGIPTPSGLPRRQSAGRRTSAGFGETGDMLPPARPRKMSTYSEEETY
jgi:hypothetical protein